MEAEVEKIREDSRSNESAGFAEAPSDGSRIPHTDMCHATSQNSTFGEHKLRCWRNVAVMTSSAALLRITRAR